MIMAVIYVQYFILVDLLIMILSAKHTTLCSLMISAYEENGIFTQVR